METDLEITLMLELADKHFKGNVITAQRYQENMLIVNERNEISVEKLETLIKN